MEKLKNIENKINKTNSIKLISDDIINKFNIVLEKGDAEILIKKLEILKKYAQKKYKKVETYKQKEEFIEIILKNIINLLNKLDYKDIYNTDVVLNKTPAYYSKVSDIKKISTINSDKNIEGGDCNSQLLYFYGLIKSITLNDEFIKYRFYSDIRDNHGKLYIITKNRIYLYHRQSKHLLIETNSIFENKKIQIEDFNEKEYIKTKKEIGLNQKKISYRFENKYLQIKSTLYGIKLKIKSSEKEIPHIKIKGFKKISKQIYKALNFIYLGRKNKFKNYSYDQLIKYIIDKIKDKEDKENFLEILPKLNKEKIINIFGIKTDN